MIQQTGDRRCYLVYSWPTCYIQACLRVQTLPSAKAYGYMVKMRDLYEVLGVSEDADDSQIKKAYRLAALQWHPGKHRAVSGCKLHLKPL
jgi:preprotein translocase subunit Sec63